MKLLVTLLFACLRLATNAQSLDDMEKELVTVLNENRGMGVFANNSGREVIFEYSSYIWYAIALDRKTLTVDDTRTLLRSDRSTHEQTWSYRILCANIKSFELKSSKNYAGPAENGESLESSMLIIKCTINGEYKEVGIGVHPKANAKTIQKLNDLLIEIKKRL